MGSEPPKPVEPEKTLKGRPFIIQNKLKKTANRSTKCADNFKDSCIS
jgi:hypothetical protein